jgi:hypothetical protein
MWRPTSLASASVLVASSVRAEPAAAEQALAEELFQQGRALLVAGQIGEACPKLEESQRLAPKLGTLLNVATCHEQQGKTASAWAEFTRAAALARKHGEPERQRYAEQHVDELARRLAKIVIEVDEAAADLAVTLDGHVVARPAWGSPVPVDPGEHRVAASASGARQWQTTVLVTPGPSLLPVKVPRLAAAAGPPAPAPKPAITSAGEEDRAGGPDPLAVAGWSVLATGVAAVAVGSYFGARVFTLKDESEPHCRDIYCDQTGVNLRDEARTAATASTVLFTVGLAVVGTGVVLLVLGATKDDEAATSARWSW